MSYLKRGAKIIVLFPFILIWDAYYFLVKNLYLLSTRVDEEGAKIIDDFLQD